ncbi:DUF192 domain-containing protein [Sulfurirhabdus autotrophica]|nr:DUF192 domain-containing protein [Sulfurirhabdus autotrophica]
MTLRMGNNFLQLDVARDGTDIHKGLMHRQALAKNSGMLFVLPQATQHCFWMKNTLIPLSIAFINHRGYVMQIDDMQPNSKQQYCTGESSRFAIEVNQGVFQVMAVKKGTRITGLPIF